MVDFFGVPGKMCDWDVVQAVAGAEKALRCISKHANIYIATGASESTETDIKTAFHRVGFDKYITGYSCKANLGIGKEDRAFFSCILDKLETPPRSVTMDGDSFTKDIEPAKAFGMNVIWFYQKKLEHPIDDIRTISSLEELCG